jgi:hypothetical protein
MPPTKSLFKSKTLIVNAVIGLAALYPPAADWVSHNATLALSIIGIANVALRLVTKGRVTLFGSES